MKILSVGFLAIFCFIITGALQADTAELNWLNWSQMPLMPASGGQAEPIGVAGAFVGVHNDVLIIAGGANFDKPYEQAQKTWHNDIWVLEKNSKNWLGGFKLDRPMLMAHRFQLNMVLSVLAVTMRINVTIMCSC